MDIDYGWVELGCLPGISGLFRALMAREPVVGERFPRPYWKRRDLERALNPRSAQATVELWDRVAEEGRRLGTSDLGLDLLSQIRSGRGAFVVTGQQPGFLGGPLHTLYKVATAVELAAWIREEFAVPCAPLLWNASDDVDFAEIGAAVLPTDDLEQATLALDSAFHGPGSWVGNVSLESVEDSRVRLSDMSKESPAQRWMLHSFRRSWDRSKDIGDLFSALYLGLFGGHGLLAVDARWPEIRTASRNLFARYAEEAEAIHRGVVAAGEALKNLGYERRLSPAASRFALFVVEHGRRVEVLPEHRQREALSRLGDRPETLSPNVLLRPIVQDSLFPVAAVVLGPGETSYWAEIREAYERMGVEMPSVWPRLTATLVPDEVHEALGASGPGEAVAGLDSLIRDRQWDALPGEVREGLNGLRRALSERADALKGPLEDLDRSLVDVLESVERKVDFQLQRIGEQAVGRLRARSSRMALLGRIRNLIYPKGRLQERSVASLWPLFYCGGSFVGDLVSLAKLHRERLLREPGAHLAVRLTRGI